VPTNASKGSSWWRSILRLLDQYKGIAQGIAWSGDTILFWKDLWNGLILQHTYPHQFSFAKNDNITLFSVREHDSLQDLFNTPLSEEAYEQYCELDIFLQSSVQTNEADKWTYIWGNGNYSSKKCYNHLIGSQTVQPTIKWLWNSHCQAKRKVFY
jgi:hypothetical protein